MIDQATIQKIFDAADIYEVVSDFVHLKKRGVNYVGCCPFHNEKRVHLPYLRPKVYTNVSVAVKEEMP